MQDLAAGAALQRGEMKVPCGTAASFVKRGKGRGGKQGWGMTNEHKTSRKER